MEQVGPYSSMINVLITRGHLDTKTCTHVEYHVNTKRERDESHACTTQGTEEIASNPPEARRQAHILPPRCQKVSVLPQLWSWTLASRSVRWYISVSAAQFVVPCCRSPSNLTRIIWTDHILFIHVSVVGHLSYFYFLVIMNNQVNMCGQVFVWLCAIISFGYIPRCEIAGSFDNCV